jgi:hypothetical protein
MGNRAENALAELLQEHGWIGNPSRKSRFPDLIMVGGRDVSWQHPEVDDPGDILWLYDVLIIECKSARSSGSARADLADLDLSDPKTQCKVLATYTRKGEKYLWKLERVE